MAELICGPGATNGEMGRAEGVDALERSLTGHNPAAYTNAAARARVLEGCAPIARLGRGASRAGQSNRTVRPAVVPAKESVPMQQLPPFPDDAPGFEPGNPAPGTEPVQPSQPGQPSEAPAEAPGTQPDVDVPSPASPGNDPSPTPISPVG